MRHRFLLLFHPRCGSNLITTTLAAHPAVVMYEELFHPMEAWRRDNRLLGQASGTCGQTDYYRDGADPVAFLQEQLYRRDFPPEKTAVGFKLSDFQMRSEANIRLRNLVGLNPGPRNLAETVENQFWDWLAADRDIRVIAMHRRNLLETLVSGLIAVKTKRWFLPVSEKAEPSPPERLQVPVEQFREFVDLVVASRERDAACFEGHPLLDLEYQDDVLDRFDLTMRRIEEFLEVAPLAIRQALQKQARAPVSEAVVNYAELCKAVADSKYAAYL